MFKAEIFKVWTAAQLSWKIAHVKGMEEKIAIVIQENITQLHLGIIYYYPSYHMALFHLDSRIRPPTQMVCVTNGFFIIFLIPRI